MALEFFNTSGGGGGGGALVYWTENGGTDTGGVTYAQWIPTSNNSAILSPSGNGFVGADIPDGTTAGGNARGTNAVDWQYLRNNADRVASGLRSAIGGGIDNKASGQVSAVFGGQDNRAEAQKAFIGGGTNNLINAAGIGLEESSTISGGEDNTITGFASVIGGGDNNTITGDTSTIAGGRNNTITADDAFVAGSSSNTVLGSSGYAIGQSAISYAASSFAIGITVRNRNANSFTIGNVGERNGHEGGVSFSAFGDFGGQDDIASGISTWNALIDDDVAATSELVCYSDTSTYSRHIHAFYNDMVITVDLKFSVQCIATEGSYTAGDSYSWNQKLMLKVVGGTATLYTGAATDQLGDASMTGFETQFAPTTTTVSTYEVINLIFNAPATGNFRVAATTIIHYNKTA